MNKIKTVWVQQFIHGEASFRSTGAKATFCDCSKVCNRHVIVRCCDCAKPRRRLAGQGCFVVLKWSASGIA